MVVRRLAERSPLWNVGFDILLVAVLIVAVINQFQLRNEIRARQNAAYSNCQASNDSRHVLSNTLKAAEGLVKASSTASPDQKKAAITFYEGQIKQIKYSDCSIYRR